jgi:ribosomal protein S18 acetylase RimI-like enzyme
VIEPFASDHVEAAASLLAERHARHRREEPLLPAADELTEHVQREWQEDGASGAIAFEHGEPAGYLVGHRRMDAIGPHLWSFVGGHASRSPELVRDLYGAASARWVENGLTRHFVFVPALPDLVDPWFRLGFGASAALAMRETGVPEPLATDVTVRRSTPDDLEAAATLDRVLGEHLTRAPSFGGLPVPTLRDYIDDWSGIWEDDTCTHFVAERDGSVVGHTLLYRRPPDLRVPADSIDLADAATDPRHRGSGVATALTCHVLGWAHEHGYPAMTADWRMTNLEASRFWPRRGFRETFLRLYRSIP